MDCQGKGNPLLATLDETSSSLYRRTTSGSSYLWLHLQSHELDDKECHRIGNTGKLSHHSLGGILFEKTDLVPLSVDPRKLLHEHHHPLHCLQGLFVLPTSELGKEETQIGKVKEERKTSLCKVLSY